LPGKQKAGAKLKACTKCKMLVDPEVEVCPNCGSRNFSEDWEGMIVIIDAEKSAVAKIMGISRPGMYAINVR